MPEEAPEQAENGRKWVPPKILSCRKSLCKQGLRYPPGYSDAIQWLGMCCRRMVGCSHANSRAVGNRVACLRCKGAITARGEYITGDVKSILGLLWDRDVVAFYGDPAWEARMPQPAEALPWTQRFSETERTTTLTITTTAAGNWPSRPVMARLPNRLDKVRIIEGGQFKPVVTDNFILVPLAGEFQAGETIRIVFEGIRRLPDHDGLKQAEAVLKDLPADAVPGLRYALGRAGANRSELVTSLAAVGATNDPGECNAKQKAMAFLITHMPKSDLRSLRSQFLIDHVDGAWLARTKAPWRAEISDGLFLDGILPCACLDEQRDAWRQDFQKRFAQRAWQQASAGEAACWLNRTIFKELNVSYHPTKRPKPNQNASESIAAGFASCTGLSILLVDACRACGIPARIAGIPAWKVANTDGKGQHGGNHNWVEIYHDGSWHCLGASEDSPLDKTWFLARVQEASDAGQWQHSIYATTWQNTGLTFPMVWNLPNTTVSAKNVTADYLRRIETAAQTTTEEQ